MEKKSQIGNMDKSKNKARKREYIPMMMDDDERLRTYFRRKIADWNIYDAGYNHRFYIKKKGRAGLVEEFSNDRDFQTDVRAYLTRLMESESLNVDSFRAALEDSILLLKEERQDRLGREEFETLLGAVIDACGFANISNFVGFILNPALAASPLKSIRENTVRPKDASVNSKRSRVSAKV